MAALPQLRHFSNEGPMLTLPEKPGAYIQSNLQKIVTDYPPKADTFPESELNGLFSGPTSIAYVFFKLSEPGTGHEQLQIAGQGLRDWAEAYLKCSNEFLPEFKQHGSPAWNGLDPPDRSRSRCGILMEWPANIALRAAFLHDEEASADFSALLPEVLKGADGKAWNEHMYGRAGYLYLSRVIKRYWPHAPLPADLGTKIIDKMLHEGPLNWKFVEKYYLGAGHGWINIITQILLTDASYAAACKPVLQQILDEQVLDPNNGSHGNWKAFMSDQADSVDRDQIQWGHGAPGVVMSLMSIVPAYKSFDPEFASKIEQAIDNAQEVIWQRGLLRKESCLCHGAAGNMLALKDVVRREHYMVHSVEERVQKELADGNAEASSFPSSLHRGLAGRTWAFYAFETGIFEYASYNDL